jgi:molecular chaperone IbpA
VLKIKGGSVKKAADRRFLNGHLPLPYHLRAGRYQCFGEPNTAAHPQKPGPMAGGYIQANSAKVVFRFCVRIRSIQQSLNGGLPMATYDLAPFYRSTVGFDRFFSLLDQAAAGGSPGYPPYNIERTGENAYRITVAVSGFSQGELSIVAKENTLTIKGEKSANENGQDKSEVLYRGIAARAFERAFQLADFVVVKNASLENGLLHVDLVREIPEAKKPRNIPISTKAEAAQVVDGSTEKAAA